MATIGISSRRWAARVAATAVVLGSVAGMTAGLTAAQAAPSATKSATVVKVVSRMPFGKMLAKTNGRSLYILPKGSCGSACLAAWPPLFMPKGKTKALGTKCLGTVKFQGKLQVTYRGKKLYTFEGDTGSSVTGNGLSGFKVAKISASACPK